MKYHPDKNVNAENAAAIFIVIDNAYRILMNDRTKREYDAFLNKSGTRNATIDYHRTRSPLINETLSEFNVILWDMDDVLKKATDENLAARIRNTSLYDFLLRFFGCLEKEILNEDYRFRDYAGKKNKIKSYLENYFNLLRVEIDKRITALKPETHAKELSRFLDVKNKMIGYLGDIYKSGIV